MVLSKHHKDYRQCSLTVMDNIADNDIVFDNDGICNYYYDYRNAVAENVFQGDDGRQRLNLIVDRIKSKGRNKKYDCIIGLSGGVDSSYVALLVSEFGLRPLAVHFDNGWNSELALNNIESIVTKLNFDLHTLVVDWEEFKDIQLSYLKASVVDIEAVTDHAIFATVFKLAKKYKINFILSGTNVLTEHIMPPSWNYKKMDYANLRDIHKQFGKQPMRSYPVIDFKKHIYYSAFLRLNPISILNYVPYVKKEVVEVLKLKLGWRDYGGKHYESVFTKFYQAYILPEKFHIDKRKAHLSNLICSLQLTRAEALEELEKPLYLPKQLETDKQYVLKKLGLTNGEFENLMNLPVRKHEYFKTDTRLKAKYMTFLTRTHKLRRVFS